MIRRKELKKCFTFHNEVLRPSMSNLLAVFMRFHTSPFNKFFSFADVENGYFNSTAVFEFLRTNHRFSFNVYLELMLSP